MPKLGPSPRHTPDPGTARPPQPARGPGHPHVRACALAVQRPAQSPHPRVPSARFKHLFHQSVLLDVAHASESDSDGLNTVAIRPTVHCVLEPDHESATAHIDVAPSRDAQQCHGVRSIPSPHRHHATACDAVRCCFLFRILTA
ncbi:hypothetical protein BV25DRAFT_1136991 [Artomyces pyxidatus]|uniref:Uncharacterized protein n=1 Tax=Artomyces pyxidatus TaxID=48021 RepID=A0ACB8ST61_9AGAM|nr:hypothetical protein BV25DRAFT_1136991 [Artomyces pyxidatus]